MLLLENILVAGTQAHDLGHVDLVEGRQHGGGILRFLEAARDGLAQLRHFHALFARRIIDGRGRTHRDRSRHRSSRVGKSGEHIALQHLAALARTGNAAGVEAVFGGDLGG